MKAFESMQRVLVVHEDPTTRSELQEAGFDTRIPVAGEDVLQLMRTWLPDLVVLGLRPLEDRRLQLLRFIKHADPRVLTILVSDGPDYVDDFTSWLADSLVVRNTAAPGLGPTARGLLAERHGRDRLTTPSP